MVNPWITFLFPLALLIGLGWLLRIYCAPPLCWFLLSLALATILVMLLACLMSLASCICGRRG